MPTYDYRCDQDHLHSEIRSISDPQAITKCPTCDQDLKRIFVPTPVIFKGMGWVSTDKLT
jgi:putative FmdB family regulatory protein